MRTFSPDLLQAYAAINVLEAAFLAASEGPLLEELGSFLVTSVKNRIRDTKENPYGLDWEEWATGTRKVRERKGNIVQGLLWDTGELLNSIQAHISPGTVAVGSPLEYARYLQEGTVHMPAREFLGFSAEDLAGIDEIIDTYLRRSML